MTREKAVARSFLVTKATLIGRSGHKPPHVGQLEFLYDLAGEAPDGVAAQVGVYYGGSMACWATAREGRGELIAVGNWSSSPDYDTASEFRVAMEEFGLEVGLLRMDGWRAPRLIGHRVAFCFIDDDHSFWGIAKELAAWSEVIIPGGILAMHDYHVCKPVVAVEALVDVWQHFEQWERIGLVGSTIAFRRPR